MNVPELVLMEVDALLGRNEPDEEIRDLLQASVGLNLGLDFLPGSRCSIWRPATPPERISRPPPCGLMPLSLMWTGRRAIRTFCAGISRFISSTMAPRSTSITIGGTSPLKPAPAFPPSAITFCCPGPRVSKCSTVLSAPGSAIRVLRYSKRTGCVAAAGAGRRYPGREARGYVDYLVRRLNVTSLFIEEAVRARAALLL